MFDVYNKIDKRIAYTLETEEEAQKKADDLNEYGGNEWTIRETDEAKSYCEYRNDYGMNKIIFKI